MCYAGTLCTYRSSVLSVHAFMQLFDFVRFLMSNFFRWPSFFYKLSNPFPVNLLSCLLKSAYDIIFLLPRTFFVSPFTFFYTSPQINIREYELFVYNPVLALSEVTVVVDSLLLLEEQF